MSRRVLLVEDDPGVAAAMEAMLEDMGWTVYTASSATQAYIELESRLPDVVLLDVDLPDTSGFNVLRRIRASGTIPVIMISGVETPERLAESRGAGAPFILKPFSAARLVSALDQVSPKSF